MEGQVSNDDDGEEQQVWMFGPQYCIECVCEEGRLFTAGGCIAGYAVCNSRFEVKIRRCKCRKPTR